MSRRQNRALVACPECRGHRVGRIGTRQYFCSDCCLEFVMRNDGVDLFEVDEDGNLVTAGRMKFKEAAVTGGKPSVSSNQQTPD